MKSFEEKITAKAIGIAMEQYLAVMPPEEKIDDALAAMAASEKDICDALGIVVLEQFKHIPLPEVASLIKNTAEAEKERLLQAVEIYKESLVSESVLRTIKKLSDGAVSDIFYDAKTFGDDHAAKMIEETKEAMHTACRQLYAMSIFLQKDVEVRPWNSVEYDDTFDKSNKVTHVMSVCDDRLSKGQFYVDIKDHGTDLEVMSVFCEIDPDGYPTIHLYFDNSQIAAIFKKTADREITATLENNVHLDYVSHGVYQLRGPK